MFKKHKKQTASKFPKLEYAESDPKSMILDIEGHSNERKRREENIDIVAEDASLTALTYIDLFLQLETQNKSSCSQRMVCCAAKSVSKLGVLSDKLANAFVQKIVSLLELNNDHIQAHFQGQKGGACAKVYLECRLPKYNCL